MTIDQAYRFVNYVANKKQYGYIKPDDFNLLAPQAQISVVMNAYGNPKTYQNGRPIPIIGHSMTTKTQDDLLPLLKRDDNGGAGFPTVNNELDYPIDYLHIDTLERLDVSSFDSFSHLSTSEIIKRRTSHVQPPTTRFPAVAFYSDKIRVYPNLTDVVIVYIRTPVDPVWAYTLVGINPVYDSVNSTQFELPIDKHNEICMFILQNIGINLSHNELTQYAKMQEATGI